MGNAKKGKELVQAWLVSDVERNDRHATALLIWKDNELRDMYGGLTSDMMAEALIALGEKIDGGFYPVPDKTNYAVSRMIELVGQLGAIVARMNNIDFKNVTAHHDYEEARQELAEVLGGVDMALISGSMVFDDE